MLGGGRLLKDIEQRRNDNVKESRVSMYRLVDDLVVPRITSAQSDWGCRKG